MQQPDEKASGKQRGRTAWQWVRRILTLAFMAIVIGMLVRYARTVAWGEVVEATLAYDRTLLLAAAGVTWVSLAVYACYDLLGRHYTGHNLPTGRVMAVAFVSYAFNLNLGALVGGFAFRYRLYSRLGLDNATTTRVLSLSIATNWLGYLVLMGGVLITGVAPTPPGWEWGAAALRALGFACLAAAAAYFALCAFAKRRHWSLRGHDIVLPRVAFAALQLVLSCANWSLMGAILFILMPDGPGYLTVLGVLLAAGIAGAATHVPGGLGVIEAVFLAVLGPQLGQAPLLAALFCYRAVYYLMPLVVALVVYGWLEASAGRTRKSAGLTPPRSSAT